MLKKYVLDFIVLLINEIFVQPITNGIDMKNWSDQLEEHQQQNRFKMSNHIDSQN